MSNTTRKLASLSLLAAAGILSLTAVFVGGYYYVEPTLPAAAELRNIEIQIPLSVYTRDGRLIAQFGEQKRNPIEYEEIPELIIQAFLAAEDDTFFDHPGIDFTGTLRSAFNYLLTPSDRVPGASTITQQVAREYFLSRDYSLVRKFREQIMAIRIEREFRKEEILGLYLNTRFLGQRSYGVAAAARTYFNKDLDELTLSDAAILAGIPQGPSIMNPVASPEAARDRRTYVLRRMRELGWITEQQRSEADAVAVLPTMYGARIESQAPYIAEMVRLEMLDRYGMRAYTAGFHVTTTVDSRLQNGSNRAIRSALEDYDRRHGYRGPLARAELPLEAVPAPQPIAVASIDGARLGTPVDPAEPPAPADAPGETVYMQRLAAEAIDTAYLDALLSDYPPLLDFESVVVLAAGDQLAQVYSPWRGLATMTLEDVAWAREYIDEFNRGAAPSAVSDVLARGQIVRVRTRADGSFELAQIPEVQGAFVALDPFDGAIVALNGGYDFNLDNFNRAVQSERQPGSAFKPFTFSAALDNGYTVASIFNDSPLTIEETEQEIDWRPRNYGDNWYGLVSMRYALERSINVASIRVVLGTGVGPTASHVRRFGFSATAAPRDVGISLGAGGVSAVDLARGYAAFANSGLRVEPYFIQRIEDSAGQVVFEAQPDLACYECDDVAADVQALADERKLVDAATQLYPPRSRAPRVISPQNAYLVADMMSGVIRRGTGARARRELGRNDLAGKTGTTNESRDTWFAGFNGDLVAVSWVGFNDYREQGGEEGASAALPMWIEFMGEALAGVPENPIEMPPGIVEARINPDNGLSAAAGNRNVVFEKFAIDNIPPPEPEIYMPSSRLPETLLGDSAADDDQPIF